MTKDEEAIRRIVRDELRQLLLSMQDEAVRLDRPYDTAEIDSRVYQGVAEVVMQTGCAYHPDEACPRRRQYHSTGSCICGDRP